MNDASSTRIVIENLGLYGDELWPLSAQRAKSADAG